MDYYVYDVGIPNPPYVVERVDLSEGTFDRIQATEDIQPVDGKCTAINVDTGEARQLDQPPTSYMRRFKTIGRGLGDSLWLGTDSDGDLISARSDFPPSRLSIPLE